MRNALGVKLSVTTSVHGSSRKKISRAAGLVFPSLPTAVPLWAAASGVGVSVAVGLFFGIWPASRAARLDPVDALRHE